MKTVPEPFKVFLQLREHFPRAFFFQSSETVGLTPQITVIGLEAEAVLTVNASASDRGTPLSRLDELLKQFAMPAANGIPYGNGGAFGVLGYDMVRDIEPRLKKGGYFADLASVDAVEAEIHFVKNLIVFEHATEQVHVILMSALGDHHSKRALIEKVLAEVPGPNRATVTNSGDSQDVAELPALSASLGPDRFRRAVLKLKRHIADGDVFQAVLAERFECDITSSGLDIFQNLRRLSPSAYSFYFQFSRSEFFGASPETLVKSRGEVLETHPIAGTRPRGTTESDDRHLERQLCASIKEGAEHLMLVDLARNDLGKVSKPGSVSVAAFREVMRLSNVMHLLSKVVGQRDPSFNDLDALKACFPAGTLSGAPKVRAMEILSDLEAEPRGFYGGAVVAFDFAGGMDSCIAIRAVEVQNGRAILRAGAGIVADSDPSSEYQEIYHKLKTVRRALALAEARFKAAI
jgi:anthranilate synthase component 1